MFFFFVCLIFIFLSGSFAHMLVILKISSLYKVIFFYHLICKTSNRLKYLAGLILVVGKAVPLADINKVLLKYSS